MQTELSIDLYRPHAGQEEALIALLPLHAEVLRQEGLITDREVLVMRSKEDGTVLEILEWASTEAGSKAHTNTRVLEVWTRLGEIAEFIALTDLVEAAKPFPHFLPVAQARELALI